MGSEMCIRDRAFIRTCPNISWVGHLTTNPAYGTQVGDANYEIIDRGASEQGEEYDLDIHLDTYWDNDPDGGVSKHAVRDIVIPLTLRGTETGLLPVVNRERLVGNVYAMLAATAGIGNTAITGDKLTDMPKITPSDDKAAYPFGTASATYTLSANLSLIHI